MLVLSRKRQESIRVRDDIVVTVLSIPGNRVRLGTDVPSEIQVHRIKVTAVLAESPTDSDAMLIAAE